MSGLLLRLASLFVPGGPVLSFLFTKTGLWVAVAVGLIVSHLAVYVVGYRDMAANCRTRALKDQIARAEREARVQRDAADTAARLKDEAERSAAELQTRVEDYERQITANAACRLGTDDVKRLRDIR